MLKKQDYPLATFLAPLGAKRPMKGGCQEKTSPVPPASKIFLGSQPLKLHCGLAVILRQTLGPELGDCSPILRLREELNAKRTVLLW